MMFLATRPFYLTALFICTVSSAYTQRFISKCYKNDRSLSKCLEDAANKYLSELNADELQIEFTRNGVPFTINKSPIKATFLYRDVKFYNLTNSHLTLSFNKRTKTIYGNMNIPYTRFNCYFDVSGTFGKVDLLGGGKANIDFWDIQASFISRIGVNEDGQIELEPLYYSIDTLGRAEMNMYDIVAPNTKAGESLRMVFKHFGDLIIRLSKSEVQRSFEQSFAYIGEEVVKRILQDGVYQINY